MKYVIIVPFGAMLLLFLAFEFTPLEPTVGAFKATVYFAVTVGAPLILTGYAVQAWRKHQKSLAVVLSAAALYAAVFTVSNAALIAFTSTSVWKITTIEYRHSQDPNRYIARQMMDVGALGFRKRVADTIKLTSFLSYSVEVEELDRDLPWIKVQEQRNPFGLKPL